MINHGYKLCRPACLSLWVKRERELMRVATVARVFYRHSLLSVLSWFKCWRETYSLSRYDSLETEQKSVCYIFFWVYTYLCTVTGDWAHCIFVWLSNRPIGIVEMKRTTTSWDKGFIHDKVQFNIKQKFFCDFEVFRVSRPPSWQTIWRKFLLRAR
jgi:hypothetical protein